MSRRNRRRNRKNQESEPRRASTIDYSKLMREAAEQAGASTRAQLQAQAEYYPTMEALQLGTIQKISNNLNNEYTRDARAAIGRATGDTASVRGIGQLLRSQAGETNIERQLREQAEADLALGRSLSAEQTREAVQSARSAFASRGLGTGLGSAAAEILNRDSAATARQADRRNFAANTNQMVSSNISNRYGQAAGILGAAGQMESGIAGLQVATDPYQRALASAGIGSDTSNNLSSTIGNAFNNAQQMAGSIATFNTNLLDSQYNSYMNNQAARRAGNQQASALGQQGLMGLFGGLGGGALVGAGIAI